MSFGLSDHGEKLQMESGFSGKTLEVTVYDDSVDSLSDGDDMSAVSSEPGGLSRQTISISSGDIQKYGGDYGFEKSVDLDVTGVTGNVNGAILIDNGSNNIVARSSINNPEPGPKQSLDGVSTLTVTPRVTVD